MKRSLIVCAWLVFASAAFSKTFRVVTTYPYIADIVRQVGSDRVEVHSLATGDWNPHFVIPKPSFIARLRRADLLVINGAQLEIGWLPPLLAQAANPYIQTGTRGLLDLSQCVEKIEVPSSVTRDQGDVHPEGNPHFYLDPDNILFLAAAIAERLAEIDPSQKVLYFQNEKIFSETWNQKLVEWEAKMKPLEGVRVIEYHKLYNYFLKRYGLLMAGTIEPLPGIPPTSKHIQFLEQTIKNQKIRFILQDVFNPDDASRHLSQKFSIPMVVLPHDVESVPEVKGIFSLFDEMVRRLTHE
jgi:zinc/manganese transport system substrate-binding protein